MTTLKRQNDVLSSLDERLRFAIARKRLIEFSYKGARRVAEPHDYGVQKNAVKLLVYQHRASIGGRPRDRATGWRLLDVPLIIDCTVLDDTFRGSRGDQHDKHYGWDVLYARVD